MTKLPSLILILICLLGSALAAPNSDFNREQLSPKAKAAYDRLLSACVFRIGSVGYSGDTSPEELALYDLLEDANAIDALKSLVTAGSYEGGLYGLLGLSLKNNGEFNRAVDIYKARRDERKMSQNKAIHCNISETPEHIVVQSGCIVSIDLRAKIVTDLQSGHYDSQVAETYRPRR